MVPHWPLSSLKLLLLQYLRLSLPLPVSPSKLLINHCCNHGSNTIRTYSPLNLPFTLSFACPYLYFLFSPLRIHCPSSGPNSWILFQQHHLLKPNSAATGGQRSAARVTHRCSRRIHVTVIIRKQIFLKSSWPCNFLDRFLHLSEFQIAISKSFQKQNCQSFEFSFS